MRRHQPSGDRRSSCNPRPAAFLWRRNSPQTARIRHGKPPPSAVHTHTTRSRLRNRAVLGKSGFGKTIVTFVTLRNLLKRGIPCVIFDWKLNYRDIL